MRLPLTAESGKPRHAARAGGGLAALARRPCRASCGTLACGALLLGSAAAMLVMLAVTYGGSGCGEAPAPPPPAARDATTTAAAAPRLAAADVALLRAELAAAVEQAVAAAAAAQQQPAQAGAAAPFERYIDQAWGPAEGSNTPGIEDVHAELAAYWAALSATATASFDEALRRQARPAAAEVGLQPVDDLRLSAAEAGEQPPLASRVAFLNALASRAAADAAAAGLPRVALVCTTAADVAGVRRDLLPWMQYHVEQGVVRFYLLYDGADAAAVAALAGVAAAELIHARPPWASPAEAAALAAAGAGAAAAAWGGKPGNYELMVKQGWGLAEALRRARAAGGVEADADAGANAAAANSTTTGIDWLLHLDPDELWHPLGAAPTLAAALAAAPADAPSVRFLNFEAAPEVDDVANRFEQVTLFRAHKHWVAPAAAPARARFVLGGARSALHLYANGKAAVRVSAPGARPAGPHYWAGDAAPCWASAANPRGAWRDAVSDAGAVLHYAYAAPSDVAARAARSCPPEYLPAARAGDVETVKNACFVLDFDADAYVAAAAGEEAAADFFFSRMVLSEGAPARCADAAGRPAWCALTGVERLKHNLLKLGVLHRIAAPAAVLRQHARRFEAFVSGVDGVPVALTV